jgi:hypothetical protein
MLIPLDPDSNEEVKLLSDLPRDLIIEGLKMNRKDQQETFFGRKHFTTLMSQRSAPRGVVT